MRIQAYTARAASLIITVRTIRPEEAPSSLFTAAKIHDDLCARVGAVLREHKHVGDTQLAYPAERRLGTYFPTVGDKPIYGMRELRPAGTTRDIDADWQLEIMTIRYELTLALLPAAFQGDEDIAEAVSRNVSYAAQQVLAAAGLPYLFIPGDDGQRPDEGTSIDIICDPGPSSNRVGCDVAMAST